MKIFRITLLLFIVVLLSACIAEHGDRYCPTDDRMIVLEFAYVYDGRDVFSSQVQSVELFVFDHNNLLVHRETIGSTQLNAFAGTTLSHLAPGDYRIVAWGNATPHTSTFGGANVGDHINDAYVGRLGVPRSTAPQPGYGDRLHFAPGLAQEEFTLTIPQVGNLLETLPFTRAYIGIEVFVVNFADYTGEAAAPIIEIDGAWSHFCFDRVPEGDITLRQATEIQAQYEQLPARAMFRTKLFDDNDYFTKKLRVHSALGANAVHFTLDSARFRELVEEFMYENDINSLKADPTPQRTIPIVIEFDSQDRLNVTVSIHVPRWEQVGGNPVF